MVTVTVTGMKADWLICQLQPHFDGILQVLIGGFNIL